MRVIDIGGKEIQMKGSPMTPFYYKKAFNQSFSGDLAALSCMDGDLAQFDDINMLQMIWAMEVTAKGGKIDLPFEKWLEQFEYMDLTELMADVAEEAMDATFRDSKKTSGKHPAITG